MAADQRYCLECGERQVPASSVLLGGSPSGAGSQPAAPAPVGASPPGAPPAAPAADRAGQRHNTLMVIAGVGVLLLAMGVGVLIGRSGAAKQSAAPAQVITVAGAPSSGTTTSASSEAPFTSSWRSGTTGYTVQLQTLPQSGTAVNAVESAKAAATAKGANAVGVLKSEEFSSLIAGSYVIYSGVYSKKPEAEKALTGLKKSFPDATVVSVSNGGSSSSSSAEPPSSSPGGVGQSETHPAPPSALKSLKAVKGKSYEEKSKNLPDVVED